MLTTATAAGNDSGGAIRVVQFGLGPIGSACANVLLHKESTGMVKLVGAIDIDPAKAGRTVGSLLCRDSTVSVSGNASDVLARTRPDVVIHTTGSFLEDIEDQISLCARAGAHVISSSEELSYPYSRSPSVAEHLDAVASAHEVTIVGTGVNPGFAMDALVLTATGICTHVRSVRAVRVVDASRRREPLQRKIGAGIAPEEFDAQKRTGRFGHIGLRESLLMVANGLGWRLNTTTETLSPVLADSPVETPYVYVKPGQVAGIRQTAHGNCGAGQVVSLELQMFVGAVKPTDTVTVDGEPPVSLEFHGGIFGDTATIGALVNAIPLAMDAQPGLTTVTKLPIPRAFATRRVAY